MLEKDAMNILMTFLDKKAREAEEEITQKGSLSDDKAIPLILKAQFNHISHLEEIMDRRFGEVDRRFEKMQSEMDRRFGLVDKRFERLERNLFGGFGLLAFLMTFLHFMR